MPEYNPPVGSFYSEVQIPIYINPFKIIGRGGRNLIYITEETDCHYIWVDIKRKVVEIWGRERSLPRAIAKVRRMIHKILAKTLKVPDEYYELPSHMRDVLSVYSWKQTGTVMYEVVGPENLCSTFYETVHTRYPDSLVKIVQKKPGGIIITRLIT